MEPNVDARLGDESFDVFISHASEDKAEVATPLAKALKERGVRVWLDNQELVLGDSLARKIDEGLATSKFGVVILSSHFFGKNWPQRELDGLVAREVTEGGKVILPIWHGVTDHEVTKYSPTLAGKLAVATGAGIEKVAEEVVKALHASDAPRIQNARPITDSDELGPGPVLDRMTYLLRAHDDIATAEFLRAERLVFDNVLAAVARDNQHAHDAEDVVRRVGAQLIDATDRRLASMIPLILHRSTIAEAEVRHHVGAVARSRSRGGSTTWQDPWRFCWWLIGMISGAILCRIGTYDRLAPVAKATVRNAYGNADSLVGIPGPTANRIAEVFGPAPPDGQTWTSPIWQFVVAHVERATWLTDQYPELQNDDRDPRGALAEASLILCIAAGARNETIVGYFMQESESTLEFARLLHHDHEARSNVAEAVGMDLTTFDSTAPGLVARAHSFGFFRLPSDVAAALREGTD